MTVPRAEGEALAVCANAAADGVVGIVATPHVSRRYPTDYATAKARLTELAGALDGDVRLDLFLGAEVTAGLVASLSQERLCEWSIGGRFLLIEVENGWARRTVDLVASIARDAGLTPVWAHPERWRELDREPGLSRALARQGLIQVTAPSLLGLTGKRAQKAAWHMVNDGSASILASDVHGTRARPQVLGNAASEVELRCGRRQRDKLVEDGPSLLVAEARPAAHDLRRDGTPSEA